MATAPSVRLRALLSNRCRTPASAPAAAVFAILSKVGVYVVIRLSLLMFGADAGASAGFGLTWLFVGGLATIGFGTLGLIASRDLSRAAGFGVMISSGTVLAILGVGAVVKEPVVIDDAIAIRSVAYLGLTFDHRLIDGAYAVQFLAHLKRNLQEWDLSRFRG